MDEIMHVTGLISDKFKTKYESLKQMSEIVYCCLYFVRILFPHELATSYLYLLCPRATRILTLTLEK